MLVVGLTGNIASGKSLVTSRFAAHGATVIDADVLAREAVAPGAPALAAITRRFGAGVLGADGSLDRRALRDLVFTDTAARRDLEAIIHPEVGRLRAERVGTARKRGDQIVVCDIPLLFEVGLAGDFDAIVFVDAPEATRLARLRSGRGLSEADARAMMAAQSPAAAKRAKADFVIDNDGTPVELERRADEVWRALEARAPRGRKGSSA